MIFHELRHQLGEREVTRQGLGTTLSAGSRAVARVTSSASMFNRGTKREE